MSVSRCMCSCIWVSIYPHVCVIHVSGWDCLSVSICIYLCLSVCLYIHASLCVHVCDHVPPCLCVHVSLSVHMAVAVSLHLCVLVSITVSVSTYVCPPLWLHPHVCPCVPVYLCSINVSVCPGPWRSTEVILKENVSHHSLARAQTPMSDPNVGTGWPLLHTLPKFRGLGFSLKPSLEMNPTE